jgi:peptidoglycan-N-acetylglucosamine deacetylase
VTASPRLRAAGAVTLVIAGLLGSAYALGRSLALELPGPADQVTAAATNPHDADQAPGPDLPASPSHTRPPASRPAPAAPDQAGPYGSQTSTGSARIALTFDDGPDPAYTPQVLALLGQYGVKATFCVVGENAERHPDLIRAIVAGGHTLCNHSWSHDVDLGNLTPDAIRADLARTSDAIRAAAPSARIAYYRQPGGAWTYAVTSVCAELGMTPLHWAVDPADWMVPGAPKIIDDVLTEVEPGSIVLLHDAGGDRSGTVEALQYLLPELLARYQLEALPTGAT